MSNRILKRYAMAQAIQPRHYGSDGGGKVFPGDKWVTVNCFTGIINWYKRSMCNLDQKCEHLPKEPIMTAEEDLDIFKDRALRGVCFVRANVRTLGESNGWRAVSDGVSNFFNSCGGVVSDFLEKTFRDVV